MPFSTYASSLLYDIFDYQRNIVRILHTATEEYQVYSSVAEAPQTHVFRTGD